MPLTRLTTTLDLDIKGSAHQVVRSELDDSDAKLLVGGAEARVPVAELADYWFGEFLILWRHDARTGDLMLPGMRSEGVRWLRSSLDVAHGRTPGETVNDVYDEELVRRVEDFQRKHRLHVDGVAGVQTQMVLDTLNNASGAPTLVGESTEGASS